MERITLGELSDMIMALAKKKGFGTTPEEVNVPEKFALIHSEVSEAFEAYRHGHMTGKDGLGAELGDIVQRVVHLAGILGIDLEKAILEKHEINKERVWNWDTLTDKHS